MHNNLILKQANNGKGVFVNKDLKKCENLIEFHGKLFTYKQLKQFNNIDFENHSLQINENLYIEPSGEIDDFINHSCNPNCGVKIRNKKAILTAIKNIKKT